MYSFTQLSYRHYLRCSNISTRKNKRYIYIYMKGTKRHPQKNIQFVNWEVANNTNNLITHKKETQSTSSITWHALSIHTKPGT